MTLLAKFGLIVAALFIVSCTLTPVQQTPASTPTQQQTDYQSPRETRSFEKETLYELLVAEFANKRGRPDLALGHYQKQAHITKDAQVTARATQIAQQMGAQQAILDTSMLWIDIEPDNVHARVTATLQLLKYKQFDQALDQVEALLDLSSTLKYDQLLRNTTRANATQRSQIIQRLTSIIKKHPNNAQLWAIKAMLENSNNLMTDATNSIMQALTIKPDYTHAILFNSGLLIKLGKNTKALNYLEQQSKTYPLDKNLGIAYSKVLAKRKDHPKLSKQLGTLAENFPNDPSVLLSTAQIAQSTQLIAIAKKHLNLLIERDQLTIEAHNFLAQIAAGEDDFDAAAEHLKMIKPGPGYTAAQIKIASIQQRQGNIEAARETLQSAQQLAPDETLAFQLAEAELYSKDEQHQKAINILNIIINKKPEATSALYMRAMAYAELNQYQQMEKDLRIVLKFQPNNTAALNALGYTLADHNNRLEEATNLIEKAYALSPKDPAIIDSLGWLKYRMGDNEAALLLLRKAYSLFKDQEIAAHLGEILWVMDQKEEAQAIWQNGLETTPDSVIIRKAMKRLTQ
ncbi:MAG: hypothetical protein COA99_18085 [Moraxellaceae bacterium]|nr:MAG: hypothetical protein COA99_18085 [Moraxellaceae bacterium]